MRKKYASIVLHDRHFMWNSMVNHTIKRSDSFHFALVLYGHGLPPQTRFQGNKISADFVVNYKPVEDTIFGWKQQSKTHGANKGPHIPIH
jgi:hypothetical protein